MSRLSEAEIGDFKSDYRRAPVTHLQARMLSINQSVIIAKMPMRLAYWIGNIPVFTFYIHNKQYNFFSKDITAESFIELNVPTL